MVLTEGQFVGNLDAALDSLDQPTFDGLNAYFMSRAIREAGFTVALSGTGGDELFGGYPTFRDLPVLQRWLGPRGLRAARAAGRSPRSWLTWRAAPLGPGGAAADALGQTARHGPSAAMTSRALSARQRAVPARHGSASCWRPDLPSVLADGLPPAMRQRLTGETGGRTPLSAISVMEQRLFLGERLLRDNDVASMASSLEQRVPLVDHVLFESIDRLPDQARYQPLGRKAMLRQDRPARPRSGAVRPAQERIRAAVRSLDPARAEGRDERDHARPAGDRALRPRSGSCRAALAAPISTARPGFYWSRVWSVYVFIRWCHRNRVFA